MGEIVKSANILFIAGCGVFPILFVVAALLLKGSVLLFPLLAVFAALSVFCFMESAEYEFTGVELIKRNVLIGRQMLKIPWDDFSSGSAFERKNFLGWEEHVLLLEGKRKLRINFRSSKEIENAVNFVDKNTQVDVVYEN